MNKHWEELVPTDHAYHISVELNEKRMPIAYHGHDFAEIFWVEKGTGNHLINETRIRIKRGDLIFIRPSDYHSLMARRGSVCRLQNIAFRITTLERVQQNYFKDSGQWPWRPGQLPHSTQLTSEQLNILGRELSLLANARKDTLSLDCFLLNLFRLLGRHAHTHADVPDWLGFAMREFANDSTCLHEGLPRFIRLASRSPEHVARVMKSHCGLTPSSWINQCRIESAARQIETSSAPIGEIAAGCGFDNQSYFQKLFLQQLKITPLKYRQRQRQVM